MISDPRNVFHLGVVVQVFEVPRCTLLYGLLSALVWGTWCFVVGVLNSHFGKLRVHLEAWLQIHLLDISSYLFQTGFFWLLAPWLDLSDCSAWGCRRHLDFSVPFFQPDPCSLTESTPLAWQHVKTASCPSSSPATTQWPAPPLKLKNGWLQETHQTIFSDLLLLSKAGWLHKSVLCPRVWDRIALCGCGKVWRCGYWLCLGGWSSLGSSMGPYTDDSQDHSHTLHHPQLYGFHRSSEQSEDPK